MILGKIHHRKQAYSKGCL